MKVAVTGGHLSPAVATIEELKKIDASFLYLGNREQGDEFEVINELGITFCHIETGRVHRHSKLKAGLSLLRVPWGFVQALTCLYKEEPDVLLSFGGYLSVPCVIAAWCLGIPVITHEQTKQAGLANRMNGWFASRVAISWKESEKYFSKGKTILTGNPVRLAALQVKKDFKGLDELKKRKTIYVTGGHQGSDVINELLIEALPELTKKWNVIHSLGTHVAQVQFLELAEKAMDVYKGAYLAARYFGPEEIGSVFARADMVITRTGANTCTEIALLQKPALMIPLPKGQAGEQLANARELESLGLGVVVSEFELTSEVLVSLIMEMMNNLKTFHADEDVIKERFIRDAAARLATLTAQYAKST